MKPAKLPRSPSNEKYVLSGTLNIGRFVLQRTHANFRKAIERPKGSFQPRSGSARRSPKRRDHFGAYRRNRQRSGRSVGRWCGLRFRTEHARTRGLHSRCRFSLADPHFQQIKTLPVSNSDSEAIIETVPVDDAALTVAPVCPSLTGLLYYLTQSTGPKPLSSPCNTRVFIHV